MVNLLGTFNTLEERRSTKLVGNNQDYEQKFHNAFSVKALFKNELTWNLSQSNRAQSQIPNFVLREDNRVSTDTLCGCLLLNKSDYIYHILNRRQHQFAALIIFFTEILSIYKTLSH